MDITIYLPDELGKWAKDNNLGLSRMLRDAVGAEKRRRETIVGALDSVETHDLAIEDNKGRMYTARMHGALIAEQDSGPLYVYLGKDGKVYVYDERQSKLHRDLTAEDLRNWLFDGPYAEAMHALGEDVVIDVGLPDQPQL